MPVSHSHRFIFIHIPKTAGTSALETFRSAGVQMEYDGSNLWDVFAGHPRGPELVDCYRRTFRVGTLAYAQQQHMPAAVLKNLISADVWDGYFKFAFVRNPWDLLVSGYHYQTGALTPEQRALNPDASALLERCRDFSDVVRCYPMIRADMSSFFTDDRGELMVDFVGRYESIDEDFAYVCRQIGIEAPLSHENRSDHASYREYYTPETRDIVARHFARDIERFGYRF